MLLAPAISPLRAPLRSTTTAADTTPEFTADTITYRIETDSTVEQRLPGPIGGNLPITYTVDSLPTGLMLDSATRTVTGTAPSTEGTHTTTLTASDAESDTDTLTIEWEIYAGLTLGSQSDQTATEDVAFSFTLPGASGGTTPYTYTLEQWDSTTSTASAIPDWLTFDDSALTISGTGTEIVEIPLRLSVADGDGTQASATFTLSVVEYIDVAPSFPVAGRQFNIVTGSTVSQVLGAAQSGNPPLVYSVGTLPNGLSFAAATRTVSGTAPSTEQTINTTYTVTDADGDTATQTITWYFHDALALPAVAHYSTTEDALFSVTLPEATGGVNPISRIYTLQQWDAGTSTASALPNWASFDPQTRVLSGTPPDAGRVTFRYSVSDLGALTASRTFTLTINAVVVDLLPSFTSSTAAYNIETGSTVSQVLDAATSGDAPLTYSVDDLPDGLSFAAGTRRVTGTAPSTASTHTTILTVSDVDGDSDTQTITWTIHGALALGAQANRSATQDVAFSWVLPGATGGIGSYTYVLQQWDSTSSSSSPLPDWASFAADTRTFSGTATEGGVWGFRLSVTDGAGTTVRRTFTLSVASTDALSLPNPPARYDFTAGFSQTIAFPQARGGTPPYTYTLVGTTSAWLSVDTAAGTVSFDADVEHSANIGTTYDTFWRVTDSASGSDSKNVRYRINWDTVPSYTLPTSVLDVHNNGELNHDLSGTVSLGNPPFTYSLSAGLLPGTVSIASDGRLVGNAGGFSGTRYIQIRCTDLDGDSDTANRRIRFRNQLGQSITPSPEPTGTWSAPLGVILFTTAAPTMSVTLPHYSDTDSNLYSLAYIGSPPPGISWDVSTRELSGTPALGSEGSWFLGIWPSDRPEAFNEGILRVVPGIELIWGETPPANLTFEVGVPVDVQLPMAGGGYGTVTYSMTPAPPAGITATASTRGIRLHGTPTEVTQTAGVFYSATDQNDTPSTIIHSIAIAVVAEPLTWDGEPITWDGDTLRFT